MFKSIVSCSLVEYKKVILTIKTKKWRKLPHMQLKKPWVPSHLCWAIPPQRIAFFLFCCAECEKRLASSEFERSCMLQITLCEAALIFRAVIINVENVYLCIMLEITFSLR